MMMKRSSTSSKLKNTGILFRVFFLVMIIGLIGIIWQFQSSFTTLVKSPGGSFTEGVIGAPRFINPVLAQSQSDKDLTKLVFSPLLALDHEGNIDYRLADYIEISPDGQRYTLTLKKDEVFHDNMPITADDVIFTIEKIQDPLIKSPLLGRWQGIDVEKQDEYTVVFKLARPFSDFLHNLEIGILPKHIWENVSEQEFIFSNYNTNPIGSGPFSVSHVQLQESGVPQSYTLHNTKDAYIRKITLVFFDNEEEMASAYKKKDIDAMYGFSDTSKLSKRGSLYSGTLPRTFGIFFNQSQQTLLQDSNIRQAIEHGINKQGMVDQVFENYAQVINSPFLEENIEDTYDPELARSLIEKSGWKQNEEGIYTKGDNILSFDLSILNTEEMKEIAEHIASDLKSIGILMTVRSFDQGNLSQDVIRPRQYDALLFGYEVEKLSDMYAFWHSSQRNDPGLNISLYANSTVDKELNLLRTDIDQVNFDRIASEIKKEVPAVFLYSPRFTYVLPKNINIDTDLNQLKNASDRYSHVEDWYVRTRHVWNIFVK